MGKVLKRERLGELNSINVQIQEENSHLKDKLKMFDLALE